MSGSVLIRCLPAILFIAALPAVSQGQLAFNAFSTENSEAGNGAGDIPISDHVNGLQPQFQLSPEGLGDIYLVRQRYQAAIQEYFKVEPQSAAVWNKLGIAYQMMHDARDAERCYKRSLKLNPNDPKVLNNLATVQDGEKDYGGAERTYRKSLKLNPNSAIALKNLGTNLLMQHKYDKGNAMYARALELDPNVFGDRIGPKVNDPAPRTEHGTAAYFKAKSCARAGLFDCAIQNLLRAFNQGAATVKKVNEESDFASLRGTPALERLLARQQ